MRRSSCDTGVTGGKDVELTPISGRIPKQRLVQK